ncbi:MAG TPA: hypothetical protein VFQ05_05145 [Candidatus Eisenbacteria bacterium]|nr:hypothetical protein [Candidatus Eisenbacteria bacterium]
MGLAALLLLSTFSFADSGQATRDSTITGSVLQAASDSTKPILLPPVVVSAKRGARPGEASWIPSSALILYADDGSKLLLGDLRISSPLPASADLRLYGLPVDQTARDYVWGHRIGGPATAVFGSRTKVNPDVVQVALHPSLMSHQYRDTNGSLELRPTFPSSHPQALSLSSDAIERRATFSMARGSGVSTPRLQLVTSVRHSDVVPLLRLVVPELRAIPRYLDSQTHARLQLGDQAIEGFFLFGRERGDWRETIDGVEGAVLEDTQQNLAIVRIERRLPHESTLRVGASWESGQVDSEHRYGDFAERTQSMSRIVNPRIVYATRRDAVTVWASQFLVRSDPGGFMWRSSVDAGVEGRATTGWFTVQPSLAFQRFHGEGTVVHGITAKVHPQEVTLTAGYGTYADYFVFHDGIFGNVFDPGGAQRPQLAYHYVASVQYEPKRRRPFDLIRITGVRKDFDVDLWASRTGVQVLSWDLMVARGGKTGWEIACLANDARHAEEPLVGMTPFSLRAGINSDLGRWFNVSAEANYRSGAIAQYRMPGPRLGERFELDPSYYLNLALTRRFSPFNRPLNLTVTVFNALAMAGSRAELTVDQFGRRYDAPCWANLRLRYDLW